jgi:hypothetical protein
VTHGRTDIVGRVSCAAAIGLLLTAFCFGANLQISNPQVLMPATGVARAFQSPDFCARLSPDGKYLLYVRRMAGSPQTGRPVLVATDTKKETEIPVDVPRETEAAVTQFNFFSPDSTRLVLRSFKAGAGEAVDELVIFDIPSGKLTPTGISGPATLGQFDNGGKRLVVSQKDDAVSVVSLDKPNLGNPVTKGWVHSCSPFSAYAAVLGSSDSQGAGDALRLLSLSDNKTANLPVDRRNRRLADRAVEWSLDGRFACYFDLVEDPNKLIGPGTRIWDTKTGEMKAAVQGALCIGSGPTANLMIMSAPSSDAASPMMVYDLSDGSLRPMGPTAAKGVHAWAKRIVYIATDNGRQDLCVADLMLAEK